MSTPSGSNNTPPAGGNDNNAANNKLVLDYKRPLFTGIAAGAIAALAFGAEGSSVMGYNLPGYLAYGIGGFLSSLAQQFIMSTEMAADTSSWVKMLGNYVRPVITGASMLPIGIVLLGLDYTNISVLIALFGVGAGGDYLGGFISDAVDEYKKKA